MSYDSKLGVQYCGDVQDTKTGRAYRTIRMWNGSGATISKGNAVAIDRAVATKGLGMAIKLSDNADLFGCIGGAVRDIPNLSWGEVQVEGIQAEVNVATGIAAGLPLMQDPAGNDGRLTSVAAEETADDVWIVARNLTLAAANLSTVEWMNPAQL